MAMARLLCITAMLAGDVALAARTTPRHLAQLSRLSVATLPMRMFKQDCKLERPIAGLIQFPGAGLDPTPGPYKAVLKDGYFHVDCVKDYMFLHGDKHGDNKFSYELGEIANVSIVHYAAGVAKEDRQPMSHDTCFAFCRTVPEMLFFGVTNGRECYCAPYYKPMASDSSDCDAVCEGETTTMCGGKTKSSIFEMHACQSTAADLADSSSKLADVTGALTTLVKSLTGIKDEMQMIGDALKKLYGHGGDVAAAGLMKEAMIFAGKMETALKKAEAMLAKAGDLKTKEGTFAGANFEDVVTAMDAEALTSEMEQLTSEEEAMLEELQTLESQAVNTKTSTTTALSQYYEVMYFVDNNKTYAPSTCGGDLAAPPMLGTTEECAAACDAVNPPRQGGGGLLQLGSDGHAAKANASEEINKRVGGCVGFSMFETSDDPSETLHICFLFSKLRTVAHYSTCVLRASRLRLLQHEKKATKKTTPHGTACMAKLQYFEGTTLAPDPSGKCDKCLKKVQQLEWCPW